KGGGRVDVEVGTCGTAPSGVGDGLFQLAVPYAHAAALDHPVARVQRRLEQLVALRLGAVDDDAGVAGIPFEVATLLPAEGVRLAEDDVVALPGKRTQQPPVVGGGPVPVRGDERRSEEGQLHFSRLLMRVVPPAGFRSGVRGRRAAPRTAPDTARTCGRRCSAA